MKKMKFLFSTIISALCLTSCVDYGYGKDRSKFSDTIDKAWQDYGIDAYLNESGNTPEMFKKAYDRMMPLYGENQQIKGDNYNKALTAETRTGKYVGKCDADGVVSWKGIPFAKAPIKDLRFKAPQKLDDSDKVYEAYYFGHSSVQEKSIDELAGFYPQGEDCLNINLWNSAFDKNQKKPIMVWIHGGAYVQGGAVSPEYEGTRFVKNNPEVIYASFDYRTDMLGFINLSEVPGGEKYKESANLGLLDEVAALQWLKENAAAFGGDPDRITIFGESAGGGSCSALTIMPQAKGLFKRAIIQSGSSGYLLRTKEKTLEHTRKILEITGCKTVDDLLELTASDIEKVATIYGKSGPTAYTLPYLDGITLPLDIRAALDGNVRDGLEILSGTTKDEYEHWTHISGDPSINYKNMSAAMEKFANHLNSYELGRYNEFVKNLKKEQEDRGEPVSNYRCLVDQIGYLSFHAPCRYEARAHLDNGGKVYQYYFTEPSGGEFMHYTDPDTGVVRDYGAYHGFELIFEFANLELDQLTCSEEEAYHFGKIMQKFWVNFALSGDPSIKAGQIEGVDPIKWDAYDYESHAVMDLNHEECKIIEDPLKDNIDLMGDIYWSKLR